MPVKIDCPRCNAPLRVPRKLAGAYVQCPQCKSRLSVAKDLPPDPAQVGAAGGPSDNGVLAARKPPPQPPALPRAQPPAQPPIKKVARFITAEAADSTLRLAADGKLPELRLEEDSAKEKPATKSRSLNPLVMLGALSLSIVLSVVLVLIDMESPRSSGSQQKAAMRQKIERDYFGSDNIDNIQLEPYQLLLREAQRAYTRGDQKSERAAYRKVLEMLRAERGSHERGLAGSRSRDKELEETISVLLSGS